jgi:hypothetical protein
MDAPEFKLLLACCRFSYASDAIAEIHRWSGHVDWPVVLRLARRHRVQSLVAQAFYKAKMPPPPSIAAGIADDAAAIAETNLRSAAESIRLLGRFNEQSIALLFVKGLTLSALAYGDPFAKMSADIDILVGRADVEGAAAILRAMGYDPFVPAPSKNLSTWHRRNKESNWFNAGSGLVVELHTRLSDHPALIPGLGMSSPRQEVRVGPGHFLPTLNTRDLLTYLCVHGASSAWFRLKWIVDLVALAQSNGTDPEDLHTEAVRCGAGRAPAQALLLADRLSLLRLPAGLRRELMEDRASRLLAKLALEQLLAQLEPTQRPFGTVSIHLSQPLLLSGWRFKLSELARQTAGILERAL